ncbi:Scr1 family TA system antitoxin-like transcriptional regulator [Glycomyces buryatensis]|uniref:Helix-turn-helix domain-containing protein n=1 Tax=Glycomyces buryatensis TaxID=2570927 RepID=A0A4S8QAB7_9ACTN|nr:Scr1 family TA system antitoxin-like transcriptional regulator [Glycomyces buryatensis]THV41210.1 helix-turn-helix domain-containing protein [Glycomyces buryatensis]
MAIVEDSGWWFLKTMARKHRVASGRSQREVGEYVYRSEDTIRAWELGRTDIPLNALAVYAKACGISDEIAGYMRQVAEARKNPEKAIEADMRFNALFLALAEEYSCDIFKFDALIIPGPLQIGEYHDDVVRAIDPKATNKNLEDGWEFKLERAAALAARGDRPTIHFLIGEAALLMLRQVSKEIYRKQMAHLRRWAKKPGVSIRILRAPVSGRLANFDIYLSGKNQAACPPFVYTEIADSSWCIDDPTRIARYDEIRKMLWKMATRIEDYHDDDRRDRLA